MAIQMLHNDQLFTVAFRGYDKDEVDAYLASQRVQQQRDESEADELANDTIRSLEARLGAYAERITELESCILGESPRTIAALGERVTIILEQAEGAAADTVAAAQQEADAIRKEASLAADRLNQYATFKASEAEASAAAIERTAAKRAQQLEEDARKKATSIQSDAKAQAEERIADINDWVNRVRVQIKVEQIQATEELFATRARQKTELCAFVIRRDGLLASLRAVCESVSGTIETYREVDRPADADGQEVDRGIDASSPFDQEESSPDPSTAGAAGRPTPATTGDHAGTATKHAQAAPDPADAKAKSVMLITMTPQVRTATPTENVECPVEVRLADSAETPVRKSTPFI